MLFIPHIFYYTGSIRQTCNLSDRTKINIYSYTCAPTHSFGRKLLFIIIHKRLRQSSRVRKTSVDCCIYKVGNIRTAWQPLVVHPLKSTFRAAGYKARVSLFSTTFVWNVVPLDTHSASYTRRTHRNACRPTFCYFCLILTKIWIGWEILEKLSNTKFHDSAID